MGRFINNSVSAGGVGDMSSVGDVGSLTTTAKGNLVEAVNELNSNKIDKTEYVAITNAEIDTIIANALK